MSSELQRQAEEACRNERRLVIWRIKFKRASEPMPDITGQAPEITGAQRAITTVPGKAPRV